MAESGWQVGYGLARARFRARSDCPSDVRYPSLVDLATNVLARVEEFAPADDAVALAYEPCDRFLAEIEAWAGEAVHLHASLDGRHRRPLARIAMAAFALPPDTPSRTRTTFPSRVGEHG
jgi:hypothetical protein